MRLMKISRYILTIGFIPRRARQWIALRLLGIALLLVRKGILK